MQEVKVMSLVQTRVKWSFTRHWCKALIAHLARSTTALVLRRRIWTITHSISRLRNCLFTLLGLPCCRCQMALKVRQIWKMRRRMRNYKLRWQRRHPEILVHLQTWQHKGKWKVEVIIVHSLAETTTTATTMKSTHFHLVMSGRRAMFVQTTPSSAHTAAGFFLLACGSVNGKCCQRADRCPARDTSTTSFSSYSSPSLSSSLSGLHQLRFAGRHQRHNRRPFRYVFRPLRLWFAVRCCCPFWGQSSAASVDCLFIFRILHTLCTGFCHQLWVMSQRMRQFSLLCSVSTLRFCQCPLSVAICRASTWRRRVLCMCVCAGACLCVL